MLSSINERRVIPHMKRGEHMKNYKSQTDWIHNDSLTVIAYGELSVCLEHRSVEVCGQEIELTAKEFDILALLIITPSVCSPMR